MGGRRSLAEAPADCSRSGVGQDMMVGTDSFQRGLGETPQVIRGKESCRLKGNRHVGGEPPECFGK